MALSLIVARLRRFNWLTDQGGPEIGKLTPMVPAYLFYGLQKATKKWKK